MHTEPRIRGSKRKRIIAFFSEHLGEKYGSNYLHSVFGTAFRTKVSEINRDLTSTITILNKTISGDSAEVSVYWAELRSATGLLFPDMERHGHRDEN